MNYFTKNLKYLREKQNLSKSELGKRLGISQSNISRWENECNSITLNSFVVIADFFNVSLDKFIKNDLCLEDSRYIFDKNLKFLRNNKDFNISNINIDDLLKKDLSIK